MKFAKTHLTMSLKNAIRFSGKAAAATTVGYTAGIGAGLAMKKLLRSTL